MHIKVIQNYLNSEKPRQVFHLYFAMTRFISKHMNFNCVLCVCIICWAFNVCTLKLEYAKLLSRSILTVYNRLLPQMIHSSVKSINM